VCADLQAAVAINAATLGADIAIPLIEISEMDDTWKYLKRFATTGAVHGFHKPPSSKKRSTEK
jgi:hypothetical protein